MSALVLHYNFKNYVSGSNTIVNKGSLGTAYNATMNGNSSVISHDCATSMSCLSLTGEGTLSGRYLQIRISNGRLFNQVLDLLISLSVSGIRNLQVLLPKRMHVSVIFITIVLITIIFILVLMVI